MDQKQQPKQQEKSKVKVAQFYCPTKTLELHDSILSNWSKSKCQIEEAKFKRDERKKAEKLNQESTGRSRTTGARSTTLRNDRSRSRSRDWKQDVISERASTMSKSSESDYNY